MRAAVQFAGAPAAQFSTVVPDAHNEAAAVRQRLSLVCLQDPVERGQAEQMLRVFGQSTDYVSHCKVRRCVCSPANPGNAGTITIVLHKKQSKQAPAGRRQSWTTQRPRMRSCWPPRASSGSSRSTRSGEAGCC